MNHPETTRTLTFEQVVELVDCPYCGARQGAACIRPEKFDHIDAPHMTRGVAAFSVSFPKSESEDE